ncbi:MAG: 30S ribosomal protein S2 [Ignavibacteria bacterium]|nr:30S ribosomal protein S2 [Ignavibacteria bacterium]
MATLELAHLIESGAHFGHLTRRWNPKMKPYIFMEKNGIHIIDLKKSLGLLIQAHQEMVEAVSQGSTILFVGTKKQAKGVIESEAKRCGMNWVSERWLGGMLTNFSTIRKSVKRLQNIEKQETDGTFDKITKKERLFLTRERDKLKKILEGVETMSRLPGVVFVVDIKKEDIAVKEARRLNIPVFAMVDTNCDPDPIDHVIPANDDAVKTIELIVKHMADAVIEGQAKFKERKAEEVAERERVRKEHHEEIEQSEEKKVSKKHLKRKDKKEEDISEEKKGLDPKEPSSEN